MSVNTFDLKGKVALITGGTRGIGSGMAIGLAEAGADVVLVQRDELNQKTKQAIEKLGRKAYIVTAELSQRDQVNGLVDDVLQNIVPRIHIFVNCAGIQRRTPAETFSDEDWDAVIQVNLSTAWRISRDVGAHMLQQEPDASGNRGKIINIGSVCCFQGGLNVPAYAAAKGGILTLTKALSNQWASKGINVNGIAPGYIATDMNEALIADQERSRQILERIPANRWGFPEDFKGPVIFLASSFSNYVSGEMLCVDGGWMGR
ncbi:3-oxoacyl-[acyl-carrier-protein] reductase [Wickerhamomyces ciferrii]|uniref:3-oxoacyl-[acyl-carrier-protein] reductase n=1 Tax=Wickerhamomyces ciferrii (strain ATCC 14091 / BCRC 22168 / CBS 111 / JCM 3599 / NBRC 0793 / NRRL Y-1031 F-60-10) TaxID=1206466 RepID=K0KIM3_WICCF|nr:3-oxoacyl-[acyl-carrier-protein] reductase [Wickerhamomyces ciferrii]CCH42831.1 3-oxoacyl-[acyl-carrier-protein] reductase [Wickerhamomyces ciferrii]